MHIKRWNGIPSHVAWKVFKFGDNLLQKLNMEDSCSAVVRSNVIHRSQAKELNKITILQIPALAAINL